MSRQPTPRRLPAVVLGCLAAFLLSSAPLGALGEMVPAGFTGTGVQVQGSWQDLSFHDVGLSTAFTISGMLDFGVALGVSFGTLNGVASVTWDPAATLGLVLVKEKRDVPLTVRAYGSYGLVTVRSDYLTSNDLLTEGSGYSLGVQVSRVFLLRGQVSLFVGLDGSYSVARVATTSGATGVSVLSGDTISARAGATAGFLLGNRDRTNLFLGFAVFLNQDLLWQFGPRFAVIGS